jgi:alkylation response protein AidB-like acyl-CoA dehydrogenase
VDLDLTDEQVLLRDSLRKLLADQSSPEVVRKVEADADGYAKDLWRSLTEMGVIGLTVADDFGGAGMGRLDMAVVYEELGRALAPVPLFETSVIGAGLIAEAGSDAQKAEWLPRISAGEVILTPAFLEFDAGFGPKGIGVTAEAAGDGYTLSGTKFFVGYASVAERMLVLARTGAGDTDIGLFLVDPKASGVTLTKTEGHALDPRFQVDFAKAAGELVGDAKGGWAAWQAIWPDMQTALSAWFVGCGDRDVEITRDYANERVQFGRPIGSFQAAAHQIVDSYVGVNGSRFLTWQAAWARDTGRPYKRLAATAFLRSSEAARLATRTGQQIFGGIGFTNDLDTQLFFRRAKQNLVSWFDTRTLEETIATAIIDGEDA